jgi:hypothetical protein
MKCDLKLKRFFKADKAMSAGEDQSNPRGEGIK